MTLRTTNKRRKRSLMRLIVFLPPMPDDLAWAVAVFAGVSDDAI